MTTRTRKHQEISGTLPLSFAFTESVYNYKLIQADFVIASVPVGAGGFQVIRGRPGCLPINLILMDPSICNIRQFLSNDIFECIRGDTLFVSYLNPDLLGVTMQIIVEVN